MPPFLLASSIAMSAPRLVLIPKSACAPVIERYAPITTSPVSSPPSPLHLHPAKAPSANSTAETNANPATRLTPKRFMARFVAQPGVPGQLRPLRTDLPEDRNGH